MRKRYKPKNLKAEGQPLPRDGSFHLQIKSLLEDCSEEAVAVLKDLLGSFNERVRFMAASEILGKTVPTKNESIFNPLEGMTNEQLIAIISGRPGTSKPPDSTEK